jgi:hypothetical protein
MFPSGDDPTAYIPPSIDDPSAYTPPSVSIPSNGGSGTTPPSFGGDGGSGVNVGADPSGGTGTSQVPMPSDSQINQWASALGMSPAMLRALLPAALAAGGAAYGIHQNNAAVSHITDAVNTANTDARNILGGATNAFTPYQQAGTDALARLRAAPPSNIAGNFQPLAGNFNPLGTGRGLNLAQIARGR